MRPSLRRRDCIICARELIPGRASVMEMEIMRDEVEENMGADEEGD
jgi:hypothetical protein